MEFDNNNNSFVTKGLCLFWKIFSITSKQTCARFSPCANSLSLLHIHTHTHTPYIHKPSLCTMHKSSLWNSLPLPYWCRNSLSLSLFCLIRIHSHNLCPSVPFWIGHWLQQSHHSVLWHYIMPQVESSFVKRCQGGCNISVPCLLMYFEADSCF